MSLLFWALFSPFPAILFPIFIINPIVYKETGDNLIKSLFSLNYFISYIYNKPNDLPINL